MFKKKTSNTLLNFSMVIIVLFIIFFILYIWASLIIPFIIALLFSFAIIGLSNYYKTWKIPAFISFILSLATYIFIFWWIWKMIWSNIDDLIILLPEYQNKVTALISQIFTYFNVPEPTSISQVFEKLDLQYVFTMVVGWFTSIFSSAWIILFYVLFILLEYRHFKEKLQLMIADNVNKKQIIETIEKIKRDIKSYFVIKSIVSLITASASYIIMVSFWLDFAVFWALLVFILNFIPSIGSIIAVMFPALFSLVQFDSYYTFVFMTSWLVAIQVMMWNIIEPKFMWNKLNLSPLVIIISLWFWGSIWWIVGMLLAVPLMVIINIILAKLPATRSIAILLSEKWELQVDWWEDVVKTRREVLKHITWKFTKTKTKKRVVKKK